MSAPLEFGSIATTVVYVTLVWAAWKTYRHRQWINILRKNGVPMPAWSWISGHIFHLYRNSRSLPPDGSINLAFNEMASAFREDDMYLLDIWPLTDPTLVVFNPDAAIQVCQKLNLPKGKNTETMTLPLTGGPTMLSMDGEDWKFWRSLFNPGFSSSIMTMQIPQIVDFVSAFCERLSSHVGNGVFLLDNLTSQLTFEIILKISINADLDQEYSEHVFVKAMGKIVEWHSFWDAKILLNPMRLLVNWSNNRKVNSWIQARLKPQYRALRQARQNSETIPKSQERSVMNMALDAYMNSKGDTIPDTLDPGFLQTATYQMRLFLLAGNDTTSSTIVFAYHLLSKHPDILAQLRSEHDNVFGSDPTTAAEQLKKNPSLLNQCPITLAVVKETLRFYPPGATMRFGDTERLTTPSGVTFPTEGLAILIQHQSMHRNPRVWPRPDEFLPERWLVGPEHELYPKPGAWRPFEQGPRNCIGQTLAINEIKIVLIMTVRTFEIKPAYEELDKVELEGEGWFGRQLRNMGLVAKESGMYRGDRAYQTEKAGGHPSQRYPCLVSRR